MEDRFAVLDRGDPPGGKGTAVSNAVHLVDDRYPRIPWPQEVSVERMDRPVSAPAVPDGAPGCDQRLGGDLSSEDPQPLLVRTEPSVQIDLKCLEIKEVDECVKGGGHGSIFA